VTPMWRAANSWLSSSSPRGLADCINMAASLALGV